MGAAVTDLTVKRFQRHVTALSGIYYRLDKGISGGRNSRATDTALAMHVKQAREILAADARTDDAPLCAYLDSHPKLAAKWNALERRYYGLPA